MENSINLLKKKNRANEYYDGLFLLEESEMIIGYCFIALQNYINANIAELNLDRNRKHEYYDDHKRWTSCNNDRSYIAGSSQIQWNEESKKVTG